MSDAIPVEGETPELLTLNDEHTEAIRNHAESWYGEDDNYDDAESRLFAVLVDAARAVIAENMKDGTKRRNATWCTLQALGENLSDGHITVSDAQVAQTRAIPGEELPRPGRVIRAAADSPTEGAEPVHIPYVD